MADVTSPFGFPYPEDTDLVRDGAQDIENLATGVNDYLTGGYLYAGTIYYTSSGTFVKADPFGTGDIGLRAIRVRLVGGGGGGGGCAAAAAGESAAAPSGGGGGYAEAFITDIAGLSASVTVTRGAGGAGGAAGLNAGSTGGASLFGSLNGGGGGGAGTAGSFASIVYAPGASGGSATGGDLNIAGSAGGSGQRTGGSGIVYGGGASLLGARNVDQRANSVGESAAGIAGRLYGGGGNGGVAVNGGAAQAGGAGGDGIVIVDCFV